MPKRKLPERKMSVKKIESEVRFSPYQKSKAACSNANKPTEKKDGKNLSPRNNSKINIIQTEEETYSINVVEGTTIEEGNTSSNREDDDELSMISDVLHKLHEKKEPKQLFNCALCGETYHLKTLMFHHLVMYHNIAPFDCADVNVVRIKNLQQDGSTHHSLYTQTKSN